jgi:hypothetical protein
MQDRIFEYIPSLCEYTNSTYKPELKKVLLYSKIKNYSINNVINKNTLTPYKWEDIAKYAGIIHIPYNISTMSIFEQYNSNIPLFFPSKEYLFKLYCNKVALTEISYTQVLNIKNTSVIKYKDIDPNDVTNFSLIRHSINLADFYNSDMPFIQHFNSDEELLYKLNRSNFNEISYNIEKYNEIKRINVHNKWHTILKGIS